MIQPRSRSRRVASTRAASGTGQIYAWDAPSGPQRQLTHRQEGVFTGYLGWGPGELEKLLPAAVVWRDAPLRTAFTGDPHDLWHRLPGA